MPVASRGAGGSSGFEKIAGGSCSREEPMGQAEHVHCDSILLNTSIAVPHNKCL